MTLSRSSFWSAARDTRFGLISSLFVVFFLLLFLPAAAPAQENPYIVAYDHYLEEPGNLEIEYFSTFGTQRAGNDFHAFWMEFEYGATAWWTTEFYVDGQSTFGDSTIFTGVRFENRFRLLKREHFINPVLYVEYENKRGADKILKEVEGHDVESDYAPSNAVLRQGTQPRNRTQTSSLRYPKRMELHAKYDCYEKSIEPPLGVWLCHRRKQAAGLESFRKTVFFLPPKLYRRRGNVRRPRRPS